MYKVEDIAKHAIVIDRENGVSTDIYRLYSLLYFIQLNTLMMYGTCCFSKHMGYAGVYEPAQIFSPEIEYEYKALNGAPIILSENKDELNLVPVEDHIMEVIKATVDCAKELSIEVMSKMIALHFEKAEIHFRSPCIPYGVDEKAMARIAKALDPSFVQECAKTQI